MANKKGYCTKCNKNEETRRIFDVNSDVRFCYCPHCGHKYRPKVAIHNYQKVIAHYLKRAEFYLKNLNEPKNAYYLYAYVMDLEPENKQAKMGRLLSLCYLSTLRRNRFLEVEEMLRMEKELFHGVTLKKQYSLFLLSLNSCIDGYLELIYKKLTLKTYFFDVDCIKLYFKHIKDALTLKRLIVDELSLCDEEKFSSIADKSIRKYEKVYSQTMVTCDGYEHHFTSFTKEGEAIFSNNGVKRTDVDMSRYRLSTLNMEDKKLRHIKDRVWTLKYVRMYGFHNISFPITFVNFALGITFLTLFFVFKNLAIRPLFGILAIVFFVSGLAFIAIHFIFRMLLKKQRLK